MFFFFVCYIEEDMFYFFVFNFSSKLFVDVYGVEFGFDCLVEGLGYFFFCKGFVFWEFKWVFCEYGIII